LEVNFVKGFLYPELIGIGAEPSRPTDYALYIWLDGDWGRVSDYSKSWKTFAPQYTEVVSRIAPEIEKSLNALIENNEKEKKREIEAKQNKKITRDDEYVRIGRDVVTIYYAFRYHGAMYKFELSYEDYMKKLRKNLTKGDLRDMLTEVGLFKDKMSYESMLNVVLRTPELRNTTKSFFRSIAYREYDSEQMRKLLK